ncbi:class I adenylate-forming enzyme family protein [Streptomyces sp. NPDC090088]|uniref:class I adenylate-forming enzyme family protein n=1 Tax=Streptomyces sp. NPDC090088 TaxID=3365944 RepID=UPI00382DB338
MKPTPETWGTLTRVLDRACEYFADRAAIIDGDQKLTYREMSILAHRVDNGLRKHGLDRGTAVGLLSPNALKYIPIELGIWRAGGAVVQMPTRASITDLQHCLDSTGAEVLIYHTSQRATADELARRVSTIRLRVEFGDGDEPESATNFDEIFPPLALDEGDRIEIHPDDLAYIVFTSGSTGSPKGVLASHRTWAHRCIAPGREIYDAQSDEVFAHVAPLTHFSQHLVFPTIMRGGTNLMLDHFSVDGVLDAIDRHGVTAIAIVPTMLYLLLDDPRCAGIADSTLRTIVYAGSPASPERVRQALDSFGPILVQTYGGSEQGYVSCLRKEDHVAAATAGSNLLASAGRIFFDVDVAIKDDDGNTLPFGSEGEIAVRNPGMMDSYVDKSRNDEVMRDGWVYTGDTGYVSADGFLYIVDRKRDLIVTGGINVFPRQIEDVLYQHADVEQCAIVAAPHPKWGEAVTAFVVPSKQAREDMEKFEAELRAAVREEKGAVWVPKSFHFVEDLPKNPAGKVDKRTLRAPFWQDRTRQVG